MRRISRYFLAVAASTVVALSPVPAHAAPAPPAPPQVGAGAPGDVDGRSGSSTCNPGTPDTASATQHYYGGNQFFGPQQLPGTPPVAPLLTGYQRFGGLDETQFQNQFFTPSHDAYVYPPDDGFVLDYERVPIKFPQQLQAGVRIDRFGAPTGQFLAPLGTPYAQRSIPPRNLNTPTNSTESNYHVYCVLKPFTVDSGPTAPWFGQPGLGTQYVLQARYLPGAGESIDVNWLIAHQYLVEERPATACPQPGATGPETPASSAEPAAPQEPATRVEPLIGVC